MTKYQKRISGPILDRKVPRVFRGIEVPRMDYEKLSSDRVGEVRKFCKLDEAGDRLVRAAMSQLNLSARGYHRVPSAGSGQGSSWRAPYENRIGQAITDLAGSEEIQSVHLAEALHTVPMLFGNTGGS